VLDVVRRVGVMVQRTSPIQLRFAEGELTVFARTQDVGEAKESLPVQFSGEPLEIGFNARYLLDILGEIDGDTVEVHLADAAAPTLLRENDKSNALYVLMPMRV